MHAVWTNEKLGQHRPRACWPLSWHKALYKQKWDRLMRLPHLFLQDLKKIIIFLVWLRSCSFLGFPFNYIIATYKISQRIVWVMFSKFIRWMYFKSILMIKKKTLSNVKWAIQKTVYWLITHQHLCEKYFQLPKKVDSTIK